MTYTCRCCGWSQTFEDGEQTAVEQAFHAGWDTPDRFGGLAPLCPLCPTMSWAKLITIDGQQFLRELLPGEVPEHEPVHKRWEREGRPQEYGHDS